MTSRTTSSPRDAVPPGRPSRARAPGRGHCGERAPPETSGGPWRSRWLPACRLRAGAATFLLVSLAACAGRSGHDVPGAGDLRNSLPVAAAALDAGQLAVARRLYLSLSERFDDAPEPYLGLGYIAFRSDDSAAAETYFAQAAERAAGMPALRAEALLGAGRAALLQGRPQVAGRYLRDAETSAEGTPPAPWIANGLAVAAALEGDHEAAEARYAEALRLLPGNPRITANFIRMLVAAGRIDEAERVYARHPASHWPDGDAAALSRLVEEARRHRSAGAPGIPQAGAEAPRAMDPDLAMRLYLSGAPPVREGAAGRFDAGVSPPDSSGLVLRLAGWPPLPAPPAAGGSAVPAPDPSPPSATGAARSPALPEPGAGPPSGLSMAPASGASPPPADPPADRSSPATLTLALGQSRRLPLDRGATTVLVASPEVADVQLLAPHMLYVIGKGIGRTSVTVLDDEERLEERIVAVVLDLEPLRTVLAGEPDLRGVRARRLPRGVALTGEVDSAASVDRALRIAAGALPEGVTVENELRIVTPQQVNLEVRIAEVNRSVTEDLGVNWEAFRVGSESFGFRLGRLIGGFPPTEVQGRLSPSVRYGRDTAVGRIGIMIDALATAGLANVLARPNVTAISGETASFFSGGERPIPTGYDSDSGTILFEYRKVGVLLDFVPTVVDSGRIVLTVRPEVSEPDTSQPLAIGPVTLPVINVRRAETTVEVGDGESIVIAGLFSNRSSTSEAGLPGLKDIPLLGLLFGSTSSLSSEIELIVVVTARLVRPNAAPGDTGAPATTALRANGYHY